MEKMRRGWYNPKSWIYRLIFSFILLVLVTALIIILKPSWALWKVIILAVLVWLMSFFISPSFGMLFIRRFFKKRFGFKASKLPGMKVAEQQIVDHVLSLLAFELSGCFRNETMVQQKPLEEGRNRVFGEYLEDLKEREKELRSAARIVKKTKRAFWDAHMLAKALRYEVKDRYSDYCESKT